MVVSFNYTDLVQVVLSLLRGILPETEALISRSKYLLHAASLRAFVLSGENYSEIILY